VRNNTLPQVSWIVAPYLFCEHPSAPPNWGAWYVEQILAALISNPTVWASTVFIINFDEGDGFFDHIVAPTAPQSNAYGLSTVSTVNEIYPGLPGNTSYAGPLPYGLGSRVPCLVISPWSKGGYVCSQVFDHTSILQFIAARFGVQEPHITPWRAAVSGDLTAALNFAVSDPTPATHMPSVSFSGATGTYPNQTLAAITATQVSGNKTPASFSFNGQYPTTPTSLPAQETGLRIARALPYDCQADATISGGRLTITFQSTGTAGSFFHVRNGVVVSAVNDYGIATSATVIAHTNSGGGSGPWGYTVDPDTQELSDTFKPSTTSYDLSVYSANGFYRRFAGTIGGDYLTVSAVYNTVGGGITLNVTNAGANPTTVKVVEQYSGQSESDVVAPGAVFTTTWPLSGSYNWYDLVVTSSDETLTCHYAGHVETGADSVSDPYLGGGV
jgi:phospholipase C